MAIFRAVEGALVVSLASLYSVNAFTPPPLGNTANNVDRFVRNSCCASTSLRDCPRRRERGIVMLEAEAGAGGDDNIEEYKREMAEFMAQAHEKRLQAMEAVKAEVQRGYEEQIAELQGKLSALPATTSVASVAAPVPTPERVLVGAAAAGASHESAGSVHPAYAARAARPGWEARWGSEEAERASTISASDVSSKSAGVSGVPPVDASAHPAYAARFSRPGWDARWGDEEAARAGGAVSVGAAEVQVDVHPAYAARAQRPGWEARWGSEEAERMAVAPTSRAEVPKAGAPLAAAPADVHPSYAARLQRPGWETRWGDEEAARVVGAPAGEVAVAGAAAGFATAGGLDKTISDDATDADGAAAATSKDPFADEFLPDDIESLKSMVVSLRWNFQDYLLRSLEASNEIKAAKTKVDTDLSSAAATLAAEKELRLSLQESYLSYMSRSGDKGANTKALVSELENQVAKLTAEVEVLQRFAQDYMVKASSDKLKAVEEATSAARVQAELRIAALQAQILELQAGG